MSRSHGVRLTWLGHATFQIISPQEKVILIDPWLEKNPACPPECITPPSLQCLS